MRLLDKYVLKEFLAPFLFGVAAFTAIFLGQIRFSKSLALSLNMGHLRYRQ